MSEKTTPNLEASLPKGMVELCQQFRAMRGQERRALGEQLYKMLPHSPIVKDQKLSEFEDTISYDYDHPSYLLYKKDVIALLGEPDRNKNNETFYYSLGRQRSLNWKLEVEFGTHEYVINPGLFGG